MNYKITFGSQKDSKNAQQLLFTMGYEWITSKKRIINADIIYFDSEMELSIVPSADLGGESAYKNITLDELRAMASTKKEYINKTTGEYRKTSDVVSGEQWIEVPEGAEVAIFDDERLSFAKPINDGDDVLVWDVGFDIEWDTTEWESWRKFVNYGFNIIWQRPAQPEALPFVDDEPCIETATGYQLDVVGQNTYGSRSRNDGESDISYRQYLMNFIIASRAIGQSLNDQYAEIEKVRQTTITGTLAARQSTYGSFEDVACVTQDLLAILKRTGLDSLPKPHKEALHMICSKMARIVNGDHNHSDSWHDIGGYAKLIEDLID